MGCGVSKGGEVAAGGRKDEGSRDKAAGLAVLNKELRKATKGVASNSIERTAKITWGHIPKAIGRISVDFNAGNKHTSRHREAAPSKKSLKKTGSTANGKGARFMRLNSSVLRKQYTGGEGVSTMNAEQMAAQREWEDMARELPGSDPKQNALFSAAQAGHITVLQGVLEAIAEQSIGVPEGHSAAVICAAAVNGHVAAVKLLLEHSTVLGFNPTTVVDEFDNTPLKLCAAEGHSELLKVLLEAGMDVTKQAQSGKTALMAAAENGHKECVQLLLEFGADPMQCTPTSLGPVTLAARGGYREIIYMLLSAGGSPTEFADDGETPLFAAVERNHPGVVKYILKCGEGTDGQNADGAAPLMIAAQNGFVHCVDILLEFGADVNFGDADGDTPLWAASASGHLRTVKALVDGGADIDKERERGEAPLWIAAYNNHLDVVQYLISKGADVDCIDNKDVTPLLHAAACGKYQLAEILIKAGADPVAVDCNGNSAVIHAAVGGHVDILRLLADNHAELGCRNRAGDDAIQVAQEERQWECVQFLATQLGVELNTRGIYIPTTSVPTVNSTSSSSSPFSSPRKQPAGAVAEAAAIFMSRGRRTTGSGNSGARNELTPRSVLRFGSTDIDVESSPGKERERRLRPPQTIEETPVIAFVADDDDVV